MKLEKDEYELVLKALNEYKRNHKDDLDTELFSEVKKDLKWAQIVQPLEFSSDELGCISQMLQASEKAGFLNEYGLKNAHEVERKYADFYWNRNEFSNNDKYYMVNKMKIDWKN